MAASAFKYVWPTTGILRTRLAACFVLVLAERAINLAAPIAFKHMVEVLSAITADAAAAAAAEGGSLMGSVQSTLRLLLSAAAGRSRAGQTMHAVAAGGAAAVNTTMAAAAAGSATPAAVGAVAAGGSAELAAPFWVLFYPWVFIYLAAFLLRGGSGSEGLLANIRDILWIPITQVGALSMRWHSTFERMYVSPAWIIAHAICRR
jgi:ATP-binding cassette subfamily B (MDR/TAP) protein 6